MFSAAYAAAELMNADFSQSSQRDNLWDGINSDGHVQTFTFNQQVLVDGSTARSMRFGGCPRIGDVTGDGKSELIVSDSKGFVWIYPLSPPAAGRTVGPARFVHSYLGDATTASLADWNSDGQMDLVCGNSMGLVIICRGRGGGAFVVDDNKPTLLDGDDLFERIKDGSDDLDIGDFSAPLVVDWDRDGKKDLVLGEGSYSANSVYLYRNIGSAMNPSFSRDERYWLAYGMGREQLVPAVGDLDGDGDLDLVVGTRLGHVCLYLNEPRAARDKKERFLLTFKEEIPFGGVTTPAGNLTRPELNDWDGDGDLDLIIGSNDGRVQLARNTGTRKEYTFAPPEPITGTDTLKPFRAPVGYRVSYSWYPVIASRNSSAHLRMESGTNETGQTQSFCRYALVDDYVGASQRIIGSGNITLPVNKSSTLVIECRGTGIEEAYVELQHHETARLNEDTLKEGWPTQRVEFKPSASWSTIRERFTIEPEFPENDGVLETVDKSFRIHVVGESGMQFDIKRIAFE